MCEGAGGRHLRRGAEEAVAALRARAASISCASSLDNSMRRLSNVGLDTRRNPHSMSLFQTAGSVGGAAGAVG